MVKIGDTTLSCHNGLTIAVRKKCWFIWYHPYWNLFTEYLACDNAPQFEVWLGWKSFNWMQAHKDTMVMPRSSGHIEEITKCGNIYTVFLSVLPREIEPLKKMKTRECIKHQHQ
jgi:hypothetical protein